MEYFIEQAPTYAECIQKIRSSYGSDVKILSKRSVRTGGFLGLFSREGVEISFMLGNEHLRAAPRIEPRREMDTEEEKRKILANLKVDPNLQKLLSEVREIKEKLDEKNGSGPQADEHPTVIAIQDLLAANDFSLAYTRSICERLKREFSLEELDDLDEVQQRVVEWIGEGVKLYAEDTIQARPRVIVLVGPTGVGKTTTIAKLAAMYGLGEAGARPLSVRMITIDNYRIGARQQIETYGNIMNVPVSNAETFEDLRKTIALYSQDVDVILVDTIGKSPRDYMKLAEMQSLLSACGSGAEVHLAVTAGTKYSDMKEIFQQFEPFNYRSVIITKLDETVRVGNVLSAISERGKAVSFITDGQKVPKDLARAQVARFLLNLEGFRVNRRRVDERFPPEAKAQNQWR